VFVGPGDAESLVEQPEVVTIDGSWWYAVWNVTAHSAAMQRTV
jgi:hypothetical protein